ncbi:sugar MFS transporter [Mucilaginibacter boryungensis]|uniref:Sugar MFS transporter n=1 Tax=Mucilaginibacter boryungensis TaxID=768480 RepID=A0ABR9XKR6_9SPHI|nr:sugar MFS transporter [Mucilaginibacter boryungensis]MBE9667600.1 sugar MFS transporter [Mucilaginibacter boryungensis]
MNDGNYSAPNINRSMIIIGALFFIFGFVTWLSSVLIPYLKIACQLNNFKAYLVVFSFYISYLIMAIPSAWVLKMTGFKNGMAIGLVLMAVGSMVFIPAAIYRTYGFFLTGLFIQGSGLAILQTAANPYVAILGPRESAAKRISFMGICNGVAGAMAPIILGSVILADSDGLQGRINAMPTLKKLAALDTLAQRVIMPYIIISIVLMILSVVIYFSGLPEVEAEEDEATGSANAHKTSIFQFPHLIVGVFTLFLYVGVEVIAGDSIVNYGASQGIALSTAKFFTACTLSGMLVGYIVGIICIPKYFTQENALKVSAILGIIFSVAALCTSGYISIMFIAFLGLANSLMWPSIWPLAITDLGRFTKLGSSLLIMAIGGGAVLPLLYGRLADKFTPHYAYCIVVPCYFVILYYAVYGHKLRTGGAIKI